MKQYPKIDYYNKGIFNSKCIAFDKLDGSNIRLEWSKKRGFYKYGTRNVMISENDEYFGDAIKIFLNKYSEDLNKIFVDKYKNVQNFVVFAEYFGKNSFAGWHDINDTKDIVLFDVNQYKKGFISPYEFIQNFGKLHIPNIIYEGLYDDEFIINVKNNKFNLKEGVIAKGIFSDKRQGEILWMTKVKTNEWLNKVKEKMGYKALLEELNNDKTLMNEFL